jgi:hypothetical protein
MTQTTKPQQNPKPQPVKAIRVKTSVKAGPHKWR